MTVFIVTSSDREHGGKVIHGVFSTREKADEAAVQVNKDFYRIALVQEMEMD